MALLFAAVALLSSACSPIGEPASANTELGLHPVLTIAYPGSIQTLNPVTAVSSDEFNAEHFIWQGLLAVDAKGALFPVLARSVPSRANGLISADGRSISFDLRRHLRWSDGKPLTAGDVVFGWRVAVNRLAGLCPATCWDIRSVSTEQPTRLTFHLAQPFAPLLFGLPPVLPRHRLWRGNWASTLQYIYDPSTDFMSPDFPVDGPYRVRSASPSTTILVRNPQWAVLRRPAYAQVVLEGFSDDASTIRAQRNNPDIQISQHYYDLDFIRGILPSGVVPGMRVILAPIFGVEHLEPNLLPWWQRDPTDPSRFTRTNILSDVRVRQALSLALDRRDLVARSLQITPAQAGSLSAYGPENPGRFDGIAVHGAWDPITHRFVTGPHLSDATTLLNTAGWRLRSDGFRYRSPTCDASKPGCELILRLLSPKGDYARLQETDNLTRAWEAIGIKVEVDDNHFGLGNLIAPYEEHGPCANGWFDLCLFAQLPGADPQTDYESSFASWHIARCASSAKSCHAKASPARTDINYPGVRDRSLDRTFARGGRTYNLERRKRLYQSWQTLVAKKAYWIPLYFRPYLLVVRGQVKNLSPSPFGIEWNPWALAPGK